MAEIFGEKLQWIDRGQTHLQKTDCGTIFAIAETVSKFVE
jgi:hypothetical protein